MLGTVGEERSGSGASHAGDTSVEQDDAGLLFVPGRKGSHLGQRSDSETDSYLALSERLSGFGSYAGADAINASHSNSGRVNPQKQRMKKSLRPPPEEAASSGCLGCLPCFRVVDNFYDELMTMRTWTDQTQ